MPAQQFLDKLLKTGGGAIVSASLCSPSEVADAEMDDRFYRDPDGYSYVIRSAGWVGRIVEGEETIRSLREQLARKQPRRRKY